MRVHHHIIIWHGQPANDEICLNHSLYLHLKYQLIPHCIALLTIIDSSASNSTVKELTKLSKKT